VKRVVRQDEVAASGRAAGTSTLMLWSSLTHAHTHIHTYTRTPTHTHTHIHARSHVHAVLLS
jgi:hypothetical protein